VGTLTEAEAAAATLADAWFRCRYCGEAEFRRLDAWAFGCANCWAEFRCGPEFWHANLWRVGNVCRLRVENAAHARQLGDVYPWDGGRVRD
jgi:hypothetical protein